MAEYKELGIKEESWVKSQLELLRDIGVRITRQNIFMGNFLVGNLTGGLQVAPEEETERIDTRFQTNRMILRYRKFMEIQTFSSPYNPAHVAPCRYIFSELNITDQERVREMKRSKKHFPISSRNHWYIYPAFKHFQSMHGSDERAYRASRDLIESTGILEESNI